MTRLPVLAAFAVACSGGPAADSTSGTADTGSTGPTDTDTTDTDTDTDLPQGECGEVTVWDLTLVGGVRRADGAPAAGAHVWLEDRAWAPSDTVIGEGYADINGRFFLSLPGVTSVADCWATLLDYQLVGELGLSQRGERGVNSELYGAILDGSLAADLGAFPLDLEEL